MKWIKQIGVIILVIVGIYSVSMLYVKEYQEFTVDNYVNFSRDKVYKEFVNLRNLSTWYQFTESTEGVSFLYFTPYSGVGSSMHFNDKKEKEQGDIFIRKAVPQQKIEYQLFEGKESLPFLVDVAFIAQGADKTMLKWHVRTPARSFLKRSVNLIFEEDFKSRLQQSIQNLEDVLIKKVDRQAELDAIRYDTILIEQQPAELLIGLSVNAENRHRGDFYTSVQKHYNSLLVFLTQDLKRKDDEYGIPRLIMRSGDRYKKEIPYFIGAKVNRKFEHKNNNFIFKETKAGIFLVQYYKGPYEARGKVVRSLIREAEQRKLTPGELREVIVQAPDDEGVTILKIMLEIQ